MAVKFSALCTSHPIPPGRFLVLISSINIGLPNTHEDYHNPLIIYKSHNFRPDVFDG
jgi:hypothetical protein